MNVNVMILICSHYVHPSERKKVSSKEQTVSNNRESHLYGLHG